MRKQGMFVSGFVGVVVVCVIGVMGAGCPGRVMGVGVFVGDVLIYNCLHLVILTLNCHLLHH